MAVKDKHPVRVFDAALVDHRLAVILAGRLKSIDCKQTVRRGVKCRRSERFPQRLVVDRKRAIGDQPRIGEARRLRGTEEVPVERAAESGSDRKGLSLELSRTLAAMSGLMGAR